MELSFGQPTLTRSWFTRPAGGTSARPTDATSGSASASIGPRQTEALLPTELNPVGNPAPVQEVSGKQQDTNPSNADQLREAAEKANKYMALSDTFLEFTVSEQTGHVVVHVVNTETKEVVREIPPETLTRIANRTTQLQGLLFEARG